jgi:nitrate/nitrite transporter NarK
MGVPLGVEAAFAAMGLVPGASFAFVPWLHDDAAGRARATGAIAQMGNLGTVTGTPVMALVAQGGAGALTVALVAFSALGLGLATWSGRRAARAVALAGTPPA